MWFGFPRVYRGRALWAAACIDWARSVQPRGVPRRPPPALAVSAFTHAHVGSGEIDQDELRGLMNSFGLFPSDLELAALMGEVDTDGSGTVSFDEFVRTIVHKVEGDEMEGEVQELRNVFALFDRDGSGNLDASEIRGALKKLGVDLTEEEADFLVNDIDTDGDGEASAWGGREGGGGGRCGRRVERERHLVDPARSRCACIREGSLGWARVALDHPWVNEDECQCGRIGGVGRAVGITRGRCGVADPNAGSLPIAAGFVRRISGVRDGI